eukprot:tig00021073_g18020.t1
MAFLSPAPVGVQSRTSCTPVPNASCTQAGPRPRPARAASATGVGSASSLIFGGADRRFEPVTRRREAAGPSPAAPLAPRAAADPPMPSTLDQTIAQAKKALRADLDAGATRLLVDVPLPLIGKTDLDDWPGGIGQQFIALAPIQKQLASALSDGEPEEKGYLDKADSVYVWNYGEKGIMVSFASSETIKKFKQYVDENCADRPVIVLNRMWRDEDFGFGSGDARAFVGQFAPCYAFRTVQIKTGITSSVQGALQYTSAAKWQVFRVGEDGSGEQLASGLEARPMGRDLEAYFKGEGGGEGGGGLFGRLFGR